MSRFAESAQTNDAARTEWAARFFAFWAENGLPATLTGRQVVALAHAFAAPDGGDRPSDDALIPLLCTCGATCAAQPEAPSKTDEDARAPAGLTLAELLVTRPEPAATEPSLSDTAHADSANHQSRLLRDALKKMKRKQAVEDGASPFPPGDAFAGQATTQRIRAFMWQRRKTVAKSAVALLLAFVLMWVPLQRLLSTTSAQAVTNARIVTLRAPIDGVVSSAIADLEIGRQVRSGHGLLEINNPRADRGPLDRLEREHETLVTAIAIAAARRDALIRRIAAMKAQTELFRSGRLRKLGQQVAALDAELISARRSHRVASKTLDRTRRLAARGAASRATLDVAIDADTRARQRVARLSAQRAELWVEIGYLRQGTYLGDSYNDMPASRRQWLEDVMQLREAKARLARLRTELGHLAGRIGHEARRFAIEAKTMVRSQTPARIWELLVAPGEQVSRGQDLVRLLDCSAAIVTAAVSETVYQRLYFGQPATFRPRDGGADLSGWIIGLSGLAAVSSNAAIHQKALDKEPYKVTVKVPALAGSRECLVGRSGIVIFDTNSTSPAKGWRSAAGR